MNKFEEIYDLIKKIENENNEKEGKLIDLKEENDFLKLQIKSSNEVLGYKSDMSDDEKNKYDDECEEEAKHAENTLTEEMKKEYDEECDIEDKMINNALIISQLQYETSELFHELKEEIDEEKYNDYKKQKRNFYAMIDTFYNLYQGDKLYIFDILISILRKQRRVYKLDQEIKDLNNNL